MSNCWERDRGQDEEELATNSEEVKVGNEHRLYLEKWCVRLRGGEMYVEGHLLDKHLGLCPGIYTTSRICRVLEPCRLEGSSGREYILEGALVPRETEVEGFVSITLTPMFVLDRFSHGFPPNWTTLKDNWALYVGRQWQVRDGSLLATLAKDTAGRVPRSPLYLLDTPHRSSSSPSVFRVVKPRTRETPDMMQQGREHFKAFKDQGMNQKHSDGLTLPSMKKQKTEEKARVDQESIGSKDKSIKGTTQMNGIGKGHGEKCVEAATKTRETAGKENSKYNILEACSPRMPGRNIIKESQSKSCQVMEMQEEQTSLKTTAISSSARKRTQSSLFWHAEYRVDTEISREKDILTQQAQEKSKIFTTVFPKSSKAGTKKNMKKDTLKAGSPIRETHEGQSSSNSTSRSSPRKRSQNSPFWHCEYKRVEAEMARKMDLSPKEAKNAKKM